MLKLASFVGDNPVPSAHYTKPTIAAVQCLTSFRENLLPSGRVDKIMGKCYIYLLEIALLIWLSVAVGLGFAFASDLLFTAHHLIAREEDPEYHLTSIHISDKTSPSVLLYSLELVGAYSLLDIAIYRWEQLVCSGYRSNSVSRPRIYAQSSRMHEEGKNSGVI